ncbi:hypothetical protein [Pandoraea sp. NPDC087047]|uniref:hypothetical protein n=1 Tax=Pandoraea sp. NPDC087047 TaxID=3364390 RepID=UPI0037F2FC06
MRRSQTGIFLVSAAMAIAVVGMLITFWGVNQMRQMRIERAERAGQGLKIIGNAADTFVVKHYKEIEALLSAPGKSVTLKGHTFTRIPPSSSFDHAYVGNLDAKALIDVLDLSGVGSKPPYGLGNYDIRVYRKCDREHPPNCQINSLTYLTEPAKRAYTSSPDYAFAAIAVKAVGAFGGMSTMDKPEAFLFVGEDMKPISQAIPNPLRAPGLIAMRGGFLTHSQDVNVRRDGSRNITGDLDFKSGVTNQSIKGVKNIVGVGKLEMQELEIKGNATIKGQLHLSDGTDATRQNIVGARNIEGDGKLTMAELDVQGATVGGNATISGNLEAKSGASVGGALRMQRNNIEHANRVDAMRLRSESGVIQLDGVKTLHGNCRQGEIGRDANGKMLSCQNSGDYWSWQLATTTKYVTKVVNRDVERIVDRPIVMAKWTQTYAGCNGYRKPAGSSWRWSGYYGKVDKAEFCAIFARGWCDASAFGYWDNAYVYNVDENGISVSSGGTPYVGFGNTYGELVCGFRSREDALAGGFTPCDNSNNCSAPY